MNFSDIVLHGVYEDASGIRYTVDSEPEIDPDGVVTVLKPSGESVQRNTWEFAAEMVRRIDPMSEKRN